LRADTIGRIAAETSVLASAPGRRRRMARAGRRLVDGQGAYRIARAIARLRVAEVGRG
jgi:hypothetical protein